MTGFRGIRSHSPAMASLGRMGRMIEVFASARRCPALQLLLIVTAKNGVSSVELGRSTATPLACGSKQAIPQPSSWSFLVRFGSASGSAAVKSIPSSVNHRTTHGRPCLPRLRRVVPDDRLAPHRVSQDGALLGSDAFPVDLTASPATATHGCWSLFCRALQFSMLFVAHLCKLALAGSEHGIERSVIR